MSARSTERRCCVGRFGAFKNWKSSTMSTLFFEGKKKYPISVGVTTSPEGANREVGQSPRSGK